jgi:hypothetical protein
MALVTEIERLQVVISRQQKSLDSLVKEHVIDPAIRKMKVAQQKQKKYKQKYNLIF